MSCNERKTLDDWAVAAMQGLLLHPELSSDIVSMEPNRARRTRKYLASRAFDIAEEMQAESLKRKQPEAEPIRWKEGE